MSHEMIRREAEEAYGADRIAELEDSGELKVTVVGDTSAEDVVDVWALLPNADTIPTEPLDPTEGVRYAGELEELEAERVAADRDDGVTTAPPPEEADRP